MPSTGRRPGEVRGETSQANELAIFLRELTKAETTRSLERFGPKRNAWSRYRSGTDLIPRELLVAVVHDLTPQQSRHQVLQKAMGLRQAAERAVVQRAPRGGAEVEQQLRRDLNDALQARIKAERSVSQTREVVQYLMTMNAHQRGEYQALAARHEAGGPETEAELSRIREQLQRLQAELTRARLERDLAEELHMVAEQAAEALCCTLKDLESRAREGLGGGAELLAPHGASENVVEALTRIGEVLDHQGDALLALGEQLGLMGTPDERAGTRFVKGEVTREEDAAEKPRRGSGAVLDDIADNEDNEVDEWRTYPRLHRLITSLHEAHLLTGSLFRYVEHGPSVGQDGSSAEEKPAETAPSGEDAAESEPYVRLATLRTFHRVVADLNAARSLAGTLQAVVEGAVHGLGFDAAAVSLVRPDGDLVVAAVWELEESRSDSGPVELLGRVGSRESWERMLSMSDHWGTLRFVPHDRAWAIGSDLPGWSGDGPLPEYSNGWHPEDVLLAPMYSAAGDLSGVLSVDRPRSGKRPGAWTREAMEMFSLQASIAIGNARLRAEMQRALARMEREQQALRASEEDFRQAFDSAPSGMAISELFGEGRGQLTRVNDAMCQVLGLPWAALRQKRLADLVHPDDRLVLEEVVTRAGTAELRLASRDGRYQWVFLRNSVVSDPEGPVYLLSVVDAIPGPGMWSQA